MNFENLETRRMLSSSLSRATWAWHISVPLGRPVKTEVYSMYASCSTRTSGPARFVLRFNGEKRSRAFASAVVVAPGDSRVSRPNGRERCCRA